MENLQIKSNKVRLLINDDKNKVIEFNPASAKTRQKFFQIYDEIQKMDKSVKKKIKELETTKNVKGLIDLENELFEKISKLTDEMFGEGTVANITDGDSEIEMITQFYAGVTPYFAKYNNSKIEQYVNKTKSKSKRSGVMK